MNETPSVTALRNMQATVDMLQEELAATNREVMLLTLELEQRVTERTAQLSQSNKELMKEVAERMRAEAEIKQLNRDLERRAELLETANQELEAFSYSVSHDLRAPLRHIIGFAAMLVEHAGDSLGTEPREHLDSIPRAANKMSVLIDELLRFSSNARADLTRTSVDLNELIEAAIRDSEPDVKNRNVVWKRGMLPVVQGDIGLLRQVFANLVSNALKYTREREVSEIEYGIFGQDDAMITIFIHDNGVGFDPAYASKLFGVFQRLHSEREFEGIGIGLANVRRIIVRHGGKVWAQSKPGEGATFYFSLPTNP